MPKNITNGEFTVNYAPEDKVEQNYKFIRAPTNDSLDSLRSDNQKYTNSFFIQNIRTGQFTKISQSYMIESAKQTERQRSFTTNSFQTQMHLLFLGLQQKMTKAASIFQGLFAGMSLLYTITLNLSASVSKDLVRVEDQAIRIVSLLSTFGAMFTFLIAKQANETAKSRGTAQQIDRSSKTFILSVVEMIFYTISYVIYNISHTYAVSYNIRTDMDAYATLQKVTTVYTVLALLGWIVTNINTEKYDS